MSNGHPWYELPLDVYLAIPVDYWHVITFCNGDIECHRVKAGTHSI